MDNNSYVYFLYSSSYVQEKNTMENKVGRLFVPGTVVVNGLRKEYSMISETANLNRYSDTRIIAEGLLGTFKYTKPSTRTRKE